jgi:hypothetical protein
LKFSSYDEIEEAIENVTVSQTSIFCELTFKETVGISELSHEAGKYIEGLLQSASLLSVIHSSLSYTITQNLYSHVILGMIKYAYGVLIRVSLYPKILSGSNAL